MKQTVYIESSVISYLTSKPNRDVIIAARQAVTLDWGENHRHRFDLRISILVADEIGRGDPSAAIMRLEKVAEIPILSITDEATRIADLLIAEGALPSGSEEDALHIGIAAAQGADFLVESCGYVCPQLCSPEELGGMSDD
jgi:hypothetical protein